MRKKNHSCHDDNDAAAAASAATLFLFGTYFSTMVKVSISNEFSRDSVGEWAEIEVQRE